MPSVCLRAGQGPGTGPAVQLLQASDSSPPTLHDDVHSWQVVACPMCHAAAGHATAAAPARRRPKLSPQRTKQLACGGMPPLLRQRMLAHRTRSSPSTSHLFRGPGPFGLGAACSWPELLTHDSSCNALRCRVLVTPWHPAQHATLPRAPRAPPPFLSSSRFLLCASLHLSCFAHLCTISSYPKDPPMAALVFLISIYSWPIRVHAARQRGSSRSARRKYSTAFSCRPCGHVY